MANLETQIKKMIEAIKEYANLQNIVKAHKN